MNATVSISMTTFNAGEFLEPQLRSIAAQTRLPDEIVVSDDRSSDGTWERLSALALELALPIRLHRQPRNLGLRLNVQQALSRCIGDIVVLADQDDVWHPTKVESLATAFDDPNTTLWFSNARLIGEHGETLGHTVWDGAHLSESGRREIEDGNALRRLLHGMTVTGATTAVRRSIITTALPFPDEVCGQNYLFLHDGWLAALAYLAGNVQADPRTLTDYRQHAHQWSAGSMLALALTTPETKRSGIDQRRRELAMQQRRVHLVADHVRTHGLPCRPERRAELFDLDRFLSVRMLPRSSRGRRLRVLSEFRCGAYQRYARGVRTALYDLV